LGSGFERMPPRIHILTIKIMDAMPETSGIGQPDWADHVEKLIRAFGMPPGRVLIFCLVIRFERIHQMELIGSFLSTCLQAGT
jgi:hypothetical protein